MSVVNDLEIYLLKPDVTALQKWLESSLGTLESNGTQLGDSIQWIHKDTQMLIVYTPKADGNFGCLWFKTNETHWKTDLECARSAHKTLSIEVRCAGTQWNEQASDDQPGWIKLLRGEEKPFHWS